MSTLGFIDINKAPFKVFIFSMSTLKGAFQKENKLSQSKMLPKTGETTSSQSWWGLYALLGMLALFIPKFRKESK
ncbi:cell wall surface anchor family protein [Staphylococcus aureus]|uniref:LPXTG cell wall anchor domain-containing protein n=1 Tax=Staphylococcus aureus TaxID=1280 RepID=UPI00078B164C